MADSAPTTSAGRQSVGALHRIGMRLIALLAAPRPHAIFCKLTAFLLLALYLNNGSAQQQQYIVCKEFHTHRCFAFETELKDDVAGVNEFFPNSVFNYRCYISGLETYIGNQNLITVTTFDSSIKRRLFCKVVEIYNVFGGTRIQNPLESIYRVRREASPLRGRYRGQTQSQYLAIDHGSAKDEGKAEAHSAADSSRATVSGSSGMGQAQSQSMYDPSCEDCLGSSDLGAESLKRRPGATPGSLGSVPGGNGYGNTPSGVAGVGPGQILDPRSRGYGVNPNYGGTPGSDYNAQYGRPGSNGVYDPSKGQQSGGPSAYPSQGNLPGGTGNGVLGPNGKPGFGINPDGSPAGMRPPLLQNGSPGGINSGNVPTGTAGYGPGATGDGSSKYGTYPSGGQVIPGNQGFGYSPGSMGGGNMPPSSLATPQNGVGNYRPGTTGVNGVYPNQNNAQSVFPGTVGGVPGVANWPTVSGSFRGADGLNYYCCVASPNGPQFGNGLKPPGTVGLPNQGGTGQMPATIGRQGPVGPYSGGQYGPGTGGSTGGQYGRGTGGGPGGQYGPGPGGGTGGQNGSGTGSQYSPGTGGGPGGQFGPGTGGGTGGQYGPGTGGGPSGQFGPGTGGGTGGQYGPGTGGGPGGQFGPGTGGGTGGQYGPGTGEGPGGQFGPGTGGGTGGQYSPGTGGSPSGQFGPGTGGGPGGQIGLGTGGQYGPGSGAGTGGQYGPGTGGGNGGQYGPGTGGGTGGQYGPGTGGSTGGQYGPGTGGGTGGQYGPGMGGGTGGQFGPGSVGVPGGQFGPGTGGGTGGQYGPGTGGGPGGQFGPGTGGGPGGQLGPGTGSGTGGQNGPGTGGGPGGQFGPGTGGGPGGQFGPGTGGGPGGQFGPGMGGGTGGQYVPGTGGGPGQTDLGTGGQYGPGSGVGTGGQYGPGTGGGNGAQYGPGTGGGTGGQYGPGTGGSTGGQFGPGTGGGTGGQYGPGTGGGTGGQYGPGTGGGPGGQFGPGTGGGTGGQYGVGTGGGPGGQFGPGTGGGTGGQYGPNTGGGPGGQFVPGTGVGTGGQFGPGAGGGPSGQFGPGTGGGTGGQHGLGTVGTGGQYGPGIGGPGGQYGPGTGGGTGGQYGPGTGGGTGGQYGPGTGGGTGGQYGPGTGGGTGGQYGPGTGGGTGGQYGPGTGGGTGGQYGPGTGGGTGGQYGPSTGGGTGGQYGPGTGGGTGGQYGPGTGGGTGGQYSPGTGGGTGGQYGPGTGGGTGVQFGPGTGSGTGGQYGPGTGGQFGSGGGQGVENLGGIGNEVPQNVIDPNSIADGDDSEAQAIVSQAANGTVASASSKGGNQKGRAQTNVQGTYTGSGSFSAQAEITGENKAAISEVSGDKKGASSSAQGSGRNNKSQANVKLGSETGSVLTGSQSEGVLHSSNSQVQGSVKGGMADAQARGPGSTSSQAQIGFTPYKDGDKAHESQKTPFVGGGIASAQSSGRTGMSQSQLHGTFKYGITYNGAAQAGASVDKDAVFPNRLPFDKIDVFDKNNKNINVSFVNEEDNENTANTEDLSLTEPPTTEVALEAESETEGTDGKSVNRPDDSYDDHLHADHHSSNDPALAPTRSPPVESRRSFQPNYNNNNGDYDYTTEKEDTPPDDYDVDDGFGSEGNYPGENEPGYNYQSPTHLELNSPKRKGLEVRQTIGGNTQHILLGALTDKDVEITQRNSERPDESRIYQPGERVPGTGGYTIPIGFTGSVKSVASKDKTYVQGSKDFPSQAQTVSLTPGSGKVKYKYPTYGRNVNPKNLRSLHNPKTDDNNRYVSVSKSVTRDLDGENNVRKQYSHTYFTKSSSCGYFTFTCTIVSGAEGKGRKKVCKPKLPTNPDGTPMRCN